MTDLPVTSEQTPDVAETVGFLRRFSDMMATGYNAAYLKRAADLLESFTARLAASSDEQELWRYKYETLSRHADALEAECDRLKHDVEGHLDITASVLAERDALGMTLAVRENELSEFRETLHREREERAAEGAAHEQDLIDLRQAFDQKHETLQASLQARGEEGDDLRSRLERERADGALRLAAHEAELHRLRLAFDGERIGLQARLKARDDELAAFRVVAEREHDALREKLAALEAKRAELRSAFDRIGQLGNQAGGANDGAEGAMPRSSETGASRLSAQWGQPVLLVGEHNAVVPKTTLLQARAQFEYLAREFVPLGDIASQVMCELGAYTMDMALIGGEPADQLAVGVVAQSILADGENS
ncbi:MAG TPA: hypothetical protein VK804_11945 [Bradyrhizobium sp.]|uniref:hypothetical protein n=1 Tax=Bradyrhizobium sp. TaxID=376 RepID=UPI002CC78BE1|nr:hypothetical protein [Bradyrhizobium sp.]HTB01181.1 hypothetical protein [Bradyrhizobium sp.]